ncbi:MAG TPA: c-type cytochrome [Gammaproteobacteria bacterium]
MKPAYFTRILTLSALGLMVTPSSYATDITRGKILASTCFACHGTDGRSSGSIPSIYGYPVETLYRNMKSFQDGTRPATVMGRHAKGYTDEEIKLIAEYLSNIR